MNSLITKSALTFVLSLISATLVSAQSVVKTYYNSVKEGMFELVGVLREFNTNTKLLVLAALIGIAILLYLRGRDTQGNRLRKAREHHLKAMELHEKGKEEEAAEHYQKANDYREKAEVQQ